MTTQKIRLDILQTVDGLLVGLTTSKQMNLLDDLIVALQARLNVVLEAEREADWKLMELLAASPAEPVGPDKKENYDRPSQ